MASQTEARQLLPRLGALAVGGGAVLTLAVRDPQVSGHYPTCPFLAVSGFYCPGCGSLRAVHALTQGDLGAALGFNPLLLALLPVIGWLGLRWLAEPVLGASVRRAPGWVLWSLLGVVLAFWLLRNLPVGSWLAPS